MSIEGVPAVSRLRNENKETSGSDAGGCRSASPNGGRPRRMPAVEVGCAGAASVHALRSASSRRRARTTASSALRPSPRSRATVSARSTSRPARSRAISAAVNRTSGSCGPPAPSVRFERSCPTTRSRPPGATAVGRVGVDRAPLARRQVEEHQRDEVERPRPGRHSSRSACDPADGDVRGLGRGRGALERDAREVDRGDVPAVGGKPDGVAPVAARRGRSRGPAPVPRRPRRAWGPARGTRWARGPSGARPRSPAAVFSAVAARLLGAGDALAVGRPPEPRAELGGDGGHDLVRGALALGRGGPLELVEVVVGAGEALAHRDRG